MLIKSFSDRVLLPTKKDVLRVHLYFKLLENDIHAYEKDIDIILELYLFGGYSNTEEQSTFIKLCVDKNYKKSIQSVRNTLSRYINAGVFYKPRNTQLFVSNHYIPSEQCDKLVLQHTVSHAE